MNHLVLLLEMVYDAFFFRTMKLAIRVFIVLGSGIQMLTLNMICVAISFFIGSVLQGESDWPTFRGPCGNGVAPGSAPETWNADPQAGEQEGVIVAQPLEADADVALGHRRAGQGERDVPERPAVHGTSRDGR